MIKNIVLIVGSLVLLTGCFDEATLAKPKIEGQWKLANVEGEDGKKRGGGLALNFLELLGGKVILEFVEDGTVTFEGKLFQFISSMSDEGAVLKWDVVMKDGGAVLEIINEEEEKNYLELIEVTDEKLILGMMDKNKVMNLVFEKTK